jgi:uncharacterized protein (DUF983 family)
MKTCTKCGETKGLSEFHKDKRAKSGVTSRCKVCINNQKYEGKMSKTKTCTKCGETKDLSEFRKHKRGKFGVKAQCRLCQSGYKYEGEMSEAKTCSKCNETKSLSEFNKEKQGKFGVSSWCKLCQSEYNKQHRRKQAEKARERRKNDPLFALKEDLRKHTRRACSYHGVDKMAKMSEYLGCSYGYFQEYIEAQFYDCPESGTKMTWENRGKVTVEDPYKWHVDHIIPVSHPDFATEEGFYKITHYTNLRPMWGRENLSKSNKPLEEWEEQYGQA